MITRSIPVNTRAPVAAAAFATSSGDVVVIVKATFSLAHDRDATLIAPTPLVQANAWRASGALDVVNELTPPIKRACVILRGHAYAPAGTRAQSVSAWLRIVRGQTLVDKLIYAVGDRTHGSPPQTFERMALVGENAAWSPDNVGGIRPDSGRLANLANARSAVGSAHFGPVLVNDAPPPAPTDQQIDVLIGDEWIVLDGMHPMLPRVASRLPALGASAMLSNAVGASAPARLRGELLSIDADALVATLLWKGRFAHPLVPNAPIHVAVTLEPIHAETNSRGAGVQPGATPSDVDETLVPTSAQLSRALSTAVTPFEPAPPTQGQPGVGLSIPGAPWSGVAAPSSPFVSVDETLAIPHLGAARASSAENSDHNRPAIATLPASIHSEPVAAASLGFSAMHEVDASSAPASAAPPAFVDEGAARTGTLESSPLRAEITARVRAGQSLHGLDLKGADLQGMMLDGASFSGLDLSHARLTRCSLRDARLADAALTGADFREAELHGADLGRQTYETRF